MVATAAVASSSVQVACSRKCGSSESRLLCRHGVASSSRSRPSLLKLASNGSRVSMSVGEKSDFSLAGPAVLAVLAAVAVPDMAEAVAPGVSPSLKNLLLSVVAGGVVLVVIAGAVAAVSTFDPVKRK